ncbi:fused MFS/spermidine synthase [Herbiconiux moechotypicola]|uniref:Fused MFS/spermidine synthase n=1 Tax=Herbiconiux moechotypicola TaxID=637393 RepID=A0ABN3E3V4_9MICO|nr:fused MFS/spermidine synthase [Herbiconiux moechotypicola]MCS5731632.1 fused MFS/spermidine synthase [Herbiconiux moechotypicola]
MTVREGGRARLEAVLRPSGSLAELRPDPLVPGAWELAIDGVGQSHVDLADPTSLRHDYVRRIGTVIDLLRAPRIPLTVLHLGGGALTLARYVQATRPGSVQHVVELEENLPEFVIGTLPLPSGSSVTVHLGDAAAEATRLAPRLLGLADVVVCDLYVGISTPAHVRSRAFYESVGALLAPEGVLVVNVADDDGLPALGSQLEAIRPVFGRIAITGPTSVVHGRTAGNVVVLASRSPEVLEVLLPGLRAAGPHPGMAEPA